MVRNPEAPVEELSATIEAGQDHSLDVIGITPEQALQGLASLTEMTHSRRPEDQPCLEAIYLRYANARKPGKSHKQNIAYPMSNLFMDR